MSLFDRLFPQARSVVHYVPIESKVSACGESLRPKMAHSSASVVVTCVQCKETDDYRAQAMEDAIVAQVAVHFIDWSTRAPACLAPNIAGVRTTGSIANTTCPKCLDSSAGRNALAQSMEDALKKDPP